MTVINDFFVEKEDNDREEETATYNPIWNWVIGITLILILFAGSFYIYIQGFLCAVQNSKIYLDINNFGMYEVVIETYGHQFVHYVDLPE